MEASIIKTGIVLKKIQGYYYVESDNTIYECKLRGIIKRDNSKENCLAGDKVEFLSDEKVITKVLTRKNLISRPLACNIDILFITLAAKSPDLDIETLNLMILNAFYSNVHPVIIINKCDLLSENELESLNTKLSFLRPLNIDYYFVSTFKKINIDILKTLVTDKLSVFGGPSGVGKSSILNLIQDNLKLETGEVSKKTMKGKHTTKETSLLKLNCGGYVVDTPGFGFLDPPLIKNKGELFKYFPEFNTESECHFRNCIHINEPKCAVKDLVVKGEISEIRYEFYKKIYKNLCERWSTYD